MLTFPSIGGTVGVTLGKIIGILLILWGVADLGLSWANNTDVYYEIGINIPDVILPWTAVISMGIGYAIYKGGGGD